ncbi:MAG TPA: hypothetical protein VFI42_15925 [Thermomicrobiaceae bacterium]|nr:hypothetical protein [Thermomicrobiaceae bacterium]
MNGDGTTDRIDYPREFAHELRVELWAIAKRIGEIEDALSRCSVAERRSLLFRLSERLEVLSTVAGEAAGVVRGHVAALTMQMARHPDFADTIIDMPAIRLDELPPPAAQSPIVKYAAIIASGAVAIAAVAAWLATRWP